VRVTRDLELEIAKIPAKVMNVLGMPGALALLVGPAATESKKEQKNVMTEIQIIMIVAPMLVKTPDAVMDLFKLELKDATLAIRRLRRRFLVAAKMATRALRPTARHAITAIKAAPCQPLAAHSAAIKLKMDQKFVMIGREQG
jgi:hypothetical protein